jgi:hypothetical protein
MPLAQRVLAATGNVLLIPPNAKVWCSQPSNVKEYWQTTEIKKIKGSKNQEIKGSDSLNLTSDDLPNPSP